MHALLLAGFLTLAASAPRKNDDMAIDTHRPCRNLASFRAYALAHAQAHEKNSIQRWTLGRPAEPSEQPAVAKLAARYFDMCGLDEVRELAGKLVALNTVNTSFTGKDAAGFAAAATFLQQWASAANLMFNVTEDGSVFEISLGFGEPHQTWLTHIDVVSGGEGWQTQPFQMAQNHNRLYGRGIEDDKGALAAALVALRTIGAMGLQPQGPIAVAIGTDGERGGAGMRDYAAAHASTQAAIAIDTAFPVGVAEPGVGFWRLSAPLMGAASKPLRPAAIAASSGNLAHPEAGAGHASATLRPSPSQSVASLIEQAERAATQVLGAARKGDPTLRMDVHADRGNTVTLDVHGQPVYDPAQDSNSNVVWVLGQVTQRMQVAPNGIGALLQVIDGFFANNPTPLGGVFMVPTALGVVGDHCELQLYLRLPYGTNEDTFRATLASALKRMQAINPYIQEVAPATLGAAWISRARTEVTDTLSQIYKEHTGDAPHMVPLPNDSYARFFAQGIGFGPLFINQARTAHGANESLAISDLKRFGDMVMHAMLRLDFGYR